MAVSEEDVRNLIRLFEESGWDEIRLELGDLRVVAATRRPRSEAPASSREAPSREASAARAPEASAPTQAAEPAAAEEHHHVVRAPNLGTFWRQPRPGAPPYVEVGQGVDEDTEVCMIEVMKLFTPVKAGAKGTIVEVCAEDGQLVEYDQALFVIQPQA